MSSAAVAPAAFRIRALHVAERLKLKDVRDRLSRSVTEFSNLELVVRYAEDSFLFVFNYGSVVFFNVPDALQESELTAVAAAARGSSGGAEALPDTRPRDQADTSEGYLYEVVPGLDVDTRLSFDRVSVKAFGYDTARIVCMLLGESTALESYENLVEGLLLRANHYSKRLREKGRMLESSEDLIKFIGLCLDTKQEIIANLYIIDAPDETWESPVLDRLHRELKLVLEFETRYRALEYKIKIIQESIEVIVDLSKSRRENFLEIVVIALIAVEVVLSLIKWG